MFIKIFMSKEITLWGGDVMIKDLIFQCESDKFKSTHLQLRVCWLLR